MKITVEMTDAEFLEFHEFQAAKSMYEKRIMNLRGRMEYLANEICWSLDRDPKNPGKVKIIDQDHALELLDAGEDYLA